MFYRLIVWFSIHLHPQVYKMIVDRFKLIKGAVIFLAALFVISVLLGYTLISSISKAFVFPIFLYLYLTEPGVKSKSFIGFLLVFSLSGIYAVILSMCSIFYSYLTSMPYIMAYLCLLVYIIKEFNFRQLVKRFKYYLLVLLVFNGYVIFTLNQMILEDDSLKVNTLEFVIEGVYNLCILLVLSFSLLNYLYHDSRTGFLLFLASVCIVFSEMVQVAYIFISADYILNVIYSLLLIIGFYFIYLYIESKTDDYQAIRP